MPSFLDIVETCFGTKDLYEVLGVKKKATNGDIRRAYHKLSLKVHPDRVESGDVEEATKKFQVSGCGSTERLMDFICLNILSLLASPLALYHAINIQLDLGHTTLYKYHHNCHIYRRIAAMRSLLFIQVLSLTSKINSNQIQLICYTLKSICNAHTTSLASVFATVLDTVRILSTRNGNATIPFFPR